MMLFSAIGVMVIYLNVPTTTTPGLDVTTNVVTEPTTITVPSADTPTVEAPTPDTVAPEAWEQIAPTEEVITEPAPTPTQE